MVFRKLVAFITGFCFTVTTVLLPAGAAVAACSRTDPTACVVQEATQPGGSWPLHPPAGMSEAQYIAWSRKVMVAGDIRITRNDASALILKIPSGEITNQIIPFAGNPPIVWARYDPLGAVGRIDVSYLVKTPHNSVELVLKHFTPDDGRRWISVSDYMDGTYPSAAGRGKGSATYFLDMPVNIHYDALNPFDNDYVSFKGDGDGQFHNISQSGFLTAVGMAQTSYRAAFSFTAIADPHQKVSTKTSGDLFTQTVTTTVKTYVKPNWVAGLPIELGGPDRYTTAYCISSSNSTANCPSYRLVRAGVSFIPFNGGNMPMQPVLIDEQQTSQSGWTAFAFAVFTAVLTWGAASALSGAGAFSGAGVTAGGSGIEGATGLSATEIGGAAGAGYAGVTALTQGGPVTSVQKGWMGSLDKGFAQS
ncbi:MAG TPA: hypothetical protein DEP05_01800, partial [Betaproteobacteria bacterium]|nr:hypothetical protein [Betaproteobacteria bacterium]